MKYWIIYKGHVNSKFVIENYNDKLVAESRQRDLRNQHHDVLIVEQSDINEMYLQTRITKWKEKWEHIE